jgi:hypothetical protein
MHCMKFAISIPQFYADGDFDPNAFRAYLTGCGAVGLRQRVTQEQTLGSKPQLGPIETMTYAAACTQRLRLGCAVFVSTLHSPVHRARSISLLDQISRGRIEIGFGTGGNGRNLVCAAYRYPVGVPAQELGFGSSMTCCPTAAGLA